VPIINDPLEEPDETFFVNLSQPSSNGTLSAAVGTGVIGASDPPPTITVSNVMAAEATGRAVFTVKLSHDSESTITVNYATANNTAMAPGDYLSTSGVLSFAPGDTIKTISVVIADDSVEELDKTFLLNFSSPTFATLAQTQATVTIHIDPVSGRNVTVNYATAALTARAGLDYESAMGSVTIPAGQATATFDVKLLPDNVHEGDETFAVIVLPPATATVAH